MKLIDTSHVEPLPPVEIVRSLPSPPLSSPTSTGADCGVPNTCPCAPHSDKSGGSSRDGGGPRSGAEVSWARDIAIGYAFRANASQGYMSFATLTSTCPHSCAMMSTASQKAKHNSGCHDSVLCTHNSPSQPELASVNGAFRFVEVIYPLQNAGYDQPLSDLVRRKG